MLTGRKAQGEEAVRLNESDFLVSIEKQADKGRMVYLGFARHQDSAGETAVGVDGYLCIRRWSGGCGKK